MPTARPRAPRQADRRSSVLATLRAAAAPLAVAQVASAMGIAEPTAQFHLAMLVNTGEVTRTRRAGGSVGRPRWLYAPAPGLEPAAPPPDPYQALARALAAQLDGEQGARSTARRAGRRWATELRAGAAAGPVSSAPAAVTTLVGMFEGLGFAPEPRLEASEIVLHACPFVAVAREHRTVICDVHLGLAEQVAAAIGGGIAVAALEPFRTEHPLACAVRLRLPSEHTTRERGTP